MFASGSSGFSGSLDDRPACPDGNAQRLLDEHVLPCLEGEASYNVMGGGIRHDVERVEFRFRLEHGGNLAVGARACPEKSLGDFGHMLGSLDVRIADGHQPKALPARIRKLFEAVEVHEAHPSTPREAQPEPAHRGAARRLCF